ncbi:MAG: ribose 5-phosphate isomerase B [Acidobacteriota bacterium]
MKIAIGADHAGFELKNHLVERLRAVGHEVEDLGTDSGASVDYPEFGRAVGERVASGDVDRGVVVCGSGLGIGIAAGKVAGVRCAMVSELYGARMARAHNDANVVALGARIVGQGVAEEIVDVFLATSFEGGRHARRVGKIEPT